jgi:hypothetical protein
MSQALLAQTEIEQLSLSIPEQAKSLKICDDVTYQKGGELFHTIKDLRREIDLVFSPIINAAHKAHKEACDQRRKVEAPLLEGEAILKLSMANYNEELERKAKEKQRKLEDLARRLAEEATLQAAIHAEAQGNNEVAEAIISTPIEVAPIVQVAEVTKIEGVSYRENWRAEIVSLMELVKAIASGSMPITLVVANEVALNQMARALKNAMNIPGVRAVCEKTVTDGRR